MTLPYVTVCVTSFRPGGLDCLFSTLAAQDYPKDRFECVFVDEHHEARRALVASYVKGFPPFTLRHLPNQRSRYPNGCSSARARNEILQNATGEILLWLSDYALARPDWIRAHVEAHMEWGPRAVVCGPVLECQLPAIRDEVDPFALRHDDLALIRYPHLTTEPCFPNVVFGLPIAPVDNWVLSLYDGIVANGHDYYAWSMKNCSVNATELRTIGGFDEAYDANPLCLCHDTESGYRMRAAGCRFFVSKRPRVRVLGVRGAMNHVRDQQQDQALWAELKRLFAKTQERSRQ